MKAQIENDPALKLPDSIDGWTKTAQDKFFDNQNLFEYIDGAAELYISFGFSKVFNRIYTRGAGKEIILDIFYMNSCYDAYGVFSYSVGKVEHDFGMQSQQTGGSLVFWKDKYYISIMSNPETEETKKIILKLGKIIDESIPAKGEFPKILESLPEESLNRESIRYFRHYVWLNSHIFISGENILNIKENTECVQAKFGKDGKAILLIVKYANKAEAAKAKEKFINNYNSTLKKKNPAKMNSKWSGIELLGDTLIIVFNGDGEKTVKKIIGLTKEKINKSTTNY